MSTRWLDTEAALNSRARTTREYRTGFCNGCEHRDRQVVVYLRERAEWLDGIACTDAAREMRDAANRIERGEHVPEVQP